MNGCNLILIFPIIFPAGGHFHLFPLKLFKPLFKKLQQTFIQPLTCTPGKQTSLLQGFLLKRKSFFLLHWNHSLIYHQWCLRLEIQLLFFILFGIIGICCCWLVPSWKTLLSYFLHMTDSIIRIYSSLRLSFAVPLSFVRSKMLKCLVFYKTIIWEILFLTTLALRICSTTSSTISIFMTSQSLQV